MADAVARAVDVKGYRELMRALAKADRDVRLGVRKELRLLAEPVKQDAQALARSEIRRIGVPWSKMRVGITRNVSYVAPKERGVKTRGYDKRRRGQQFANLMLDRALEPALERNADKIEQALELLLDTAADRFNHG